MGCSPPACRIGVLRRLLLWLWVRPQRPLLVRLHLQAAHSLPSGRRSPGGTGCPSYGPFCAGASELPDGTPSLGAGPLTSSREWPVRIRSALHREGKHSCASSGGFLIMAPPNGTRPPAGGRHTLDTGFSEQSAVPSWTHGGLVGMQGWRLCKSSSRRAPEAGLGAAIQLRAQAGEG